MFLKRSFFPFYTKQTEETHSNQGPLLNVLLARTRAVYSEPSHRECEGLVAHKPCSGFHASLTNNIQKSLLCVEEIPPRQGLHYCYLETSVTVGHVALCQRH